jgi:hypothetical protein
MTTTTVPKKKKAKRRRISKHVIDAKEKAVTSSSSANLLEKKESVTAGEQSPTPKGSSSHLSQAIAYLQSYKAHKEGNANGGWKFNKNTQTWLIKHMYSADSIPKHTFSLLLEYMLGLEGKTRTRVLDEAAERALQYKEYEKKLNLANGDAIDKERRKEYKRARQIIEALQPQDGEALKS